jgi:hypothetical protein
MADAAAVFVEGDEAAGQVQGIEQGPHGADFVGLLGDRHLAQELEGALGQRAEEV